jgi:hypothetical protein
MSCARAHVSQDFFIFRGLSTFTALPLRADASTLASFLAGLAPPDSILAFSFACRVSRGRQIELNAHVRTVAFVSRTQPAAAAPAFVTTWAGTDTTMPRRGADDITAETAAMGAALGPRPRRTITAPPASDDLKKALDEDPESFRARLWEASLLTSVLTACRVDVTNASGLLPLREKLLEELGDETKRHKAMSA